MFGRQDFRRGSVAELERVEALVRTRYDLDRDDIVLVTEAPTRLQGGPECMTTVLFWNGTETRLKLRLFKPAAEIAAADLPPSWLRGALKDDDEAECC